MLRILFEYLLVRCGRCRRIARHQRKTGLVHVCNQELWILLERLLELVLRGFELTLRQVSQTRQIVWNRTVRHARLQRLRRTDRLVELAPVDIAQYQQDVRLQNVLTQGDRRLELGNGRGGIAGRYAAYRKLSA